MAEPDSTPAILCVDDNQEVLDSYRKILAGGAHLPELQSVQRLETALFGAAQAQAVQLQQFEVALAGNGEQACDQVRQAGAAGRQFAVAFVDMRMPGLNGLDTLEAIWRLDPEIQAVICTAYADYSWAEITARLGHSDQLLILRKPFEPVEVLQLAKALSDKWQLERERRHYSHDLEQRVEQSTHQLQEALQAQQRYQSQLQHSATHDDLTGLPNRVLLMDRLQRALLAARRHGHKVMLCFLDLDRFKWVNDHLGHNWGDELLRQTAARMQELLRGSDTLARMGGDEFVLLLCDYGSTGAALRILERMLAAIKEPLLLGKAEVAVSASIGCSVYPEDGEQADDLLRFADAAMYQAKAQGRDGIQLYNALLRERIETRLRIEAELHHAIARQQLHLCYQPQVALGSGRITGVEALLRWQHPELGSIAPASFIPIAEETGQIDALTQWVLQQAFRQGRAWRDAGVRPVRISVNVSARNLNCDSFPALVERCLQDNGLAPDTILLELTESAAMQDPEQSIALMKRLKQLGVGLSIDDFGTGYSNMHYLKRFPLDELKLDGSFVRELTQDPRSLAITGAIIAMAQQLGLRVVGEMAETEAQVLCLAELGCDQVQGYYFSQPLDADACRALLDQGSLPLPRQLSARPAQPLVLLLEAEAASLEQLGGWLGAEGYRLLPAQDCPHAQALLRQYQVDAALLSDRSLAAEAGLALLEQLNALRPRPAQLLLSQGWDFDTLVAAVNGGGVARILAAPWSPAALCEALAQALAHRPQKEKAGN